ncbi:MAG: hypothetical protein PHH91_07465 [Desulfuromonadaceae bacterium]|nr:hypothetical protein [Desulfuromonadaceae bacterium]
MSITDSYREKIRIALVQRAGDVPDASAVAEAAISTWYRVAAQLIPVIGAGGVDVLFNRSLHLTCTAFPWLTIPGDHRDNIALFTNLKERLAGREPDTAAEASTTLLGTFVELLMSLIGESLTERLLISVWEPPSPTSARENETWIAK